MHHNQQNFHREFIPKAGELNAQKLQMSKTTDCANFNKLFKNKKPPAALKTRLTPSAPLSNSESSFQVTRKRFVLVLRSAWLLRKLRVSRQVPPTRASSAVTLTPAHARGVYFFTLHACIFQALGLGFPRKCVAHVNGNDHKNCVKTHVNDSSRFQTKTSVVQEKKRKRSSLRGPPPPRPFPGEERALCVRWGLR